MTANSRFPAGGSAVIIGSSGAIGTAVQRCCVEHGAFAQVIGLHRRSSPRIELTDEDSIRAAAREMAQHLPALRLIFDATGVLQDEHMQPEKSWRQLDPGKLARAFAVNAIGPALLMKHFLPLLAQDGRAVFATLSAKVGSIGDNRLGGWYGYRASKAALNQLVRTAAVELARLRPLAICVALHPGTVDTPLSASHAKLGLKVRSPDEAASLLLDVIERLETVDSGKFFDYAGERLPW